MKDLFCSCANPLRMEVQRAPSKVRYTGRELWHQTVHCQSCSERITRYFTLEQDES